MPVAGKESVKKTKIPTDAPNPSLLIEGYGSLKGTLALPDDIDWTKPIYAQVLAREQRRARRPPEKRRASSKKVRPDVAA